jgi:hypothetical protein
MGGEEVKRGETEVLFSVNICIEVVRPHAY